MTFKKGNKSGRVFKVLGQKMGQLVLSSTRVKKAKTDKRAKAK